MSDVMHLLEDYRGDVGIERSSVPDAELLSVKEDKDRLEKSLSEMENRAKELGKSNLTFLTQVSFNLIHFACSFSSFPVFFRFV